jgi:hypothetical protein
MLEGLADRAMATLRSLIAALAVLATLLTAGAVGAARGQAMAVGEVELCADGMAVTVPVDANGHPTGLPHWCPDCIVTLVTGLPVAPTIPVAPDHAASAPWAEPHEVAAFAPLAPVPPARGPPSA